jgi:ketosteroid isomerase-like protein
MSEENVEIVRRVYDDWMRGDFTGGEVFHPEVEFAMTDWPEGSATRGREEMARAWQAALRAWDDFVAVPGEVLDAGEHVVVITQVTGRGKNSGLEARATTATMWTFEAGKVVRLGLYWDSEKALEAAGLSG